MPHIDIGHPDQVAHSAPEPTLHVCRADGRVIATPYAKRLAKDLKVDLSKIGGTGPNGRITAEDVERAAGKAPAAPAAAAVTAAAPAEAAPIAKKEKAPAVDTKVSELLGTTQPFTGMQAAIARNMEATVDVPVFLVSTSICTDALDSLYKQLKPKGVTMTALICKAAALALAKHPLINACTTADGKGCTYNADVNVAVGVAMPDGGLITPVLKRADVTDVYQLSREWADLVKRARSKQLKPDEYNSGTFTVSNLGMFDVTQFDAVLPKVPHSPWWLPAWCQRFQSFPTPRRFASAMAWWVFACRALGPSWLWHPPSPQWWPTTTALLVCAK